jgi:hypothetical protein
MMKFVNWTGTIMVLGAIVGSTLLALNVDASKWGYLFFLASSIAGIKEAYDKNVLSLGFMSFYFVIVNTIGVFRWIIL